VADGRLDPNNVQVAGQIHAEADWGNIRIVRVRTQNAPKVLFDHYVEGVCTSTGEMVRYDTPVRAEAKLFALKGTGVPVYLSFGSRMQTGLVRGTSCYRSVDGLQKSAEAKLYQRAVLSPFSRAWSTPSAVEFTVVRTARGEDPDHLAQLVEWLRTFYMHTGDWTTKPAPLYFERALRDYLADYDLADGDGNTVEQEVDEEE
jgi:hypothetical protein